MCGIVLAARAKRFGGPDLLQNGPTTLGPKTTRTHGPLYSSSIRSSQQDSIIYT
jgi:hypothetical protein